MKSIRLIILAVSAFAFTNCTTNTVVKPEPTMVKETHVRRTTSSSTGYGTLPTTTTTETRAVIAE